MIITAPLSCCSNEDPIAAMLRSPSPSIIIVLSQQAVPLSTFDWNDFPTMDSQSCCRGAPSLAPQLQSSYVYSPCEENETHAQQLVERTRQQKIGPSSDDDDDDDDDNDDDELDNQETGYPVTAAQQASLRKRNSPSKKHVSFSRFIRIRSHKTIVGDHPCCHGGMALTCDWDLAGDDEMVALDLFEALSLKRKSDELRLSFGERRERLQAAGLSPSEIVQQESELNFGFSLNSKLHVSPSVQRALVALAAARSQSELRQQSC